MVSLSSLSAVSDGNPQTVKVVDLRKGDHGRSSFGAFPSS